MRWRKRADQHGARRAFRLTDEVEAPMDAIGAVHVGKARWPEHDRIALGPSAEAVGGRIGVMVGLDLHYDTADVGEQQRGADQVGRHRVNAAGEEAWAEQDGHCAVFNRVLSEPLAFERSCSSAVGRNQACRRCSLILPRFCPASDARLKCKRCSNATDGRMLRWISTWVLALFELSAILVGSEKRRSLVL